MAARQTDLALYRKLWRQAQGYRLHIAALFGISILSSALKLLTPLPLMIGVDSVLGSQPLPDFLDALLTAAGTRSAESILLLAAALLVAIAVLIQVVGLAGNLLS